jgi:hypothetical protein
MGNQSFGNNESFLGHNAVYQRAFIFILAAVRTSNLDIDVEIRRKIISVNIFYSVQLFLNGSETWFVILSENMH